MNSPDYRRGARQIRLITTGGTIEKTYDELSGVLNNEVGVLDMMLARLCLNGLIVEHEVLMNKDSLHMTEEDHATIVQAVIRAQNSVEGVVIIHGTDRLATTGETICRSITPTIPVVLTGAMRPWIMKNTDALQNLTEALLSVQLLEPGVYVTMHNRVLKFPGVVKDVEKGRFVCVNT